MQFSDLVIGLKLNLADFNRAMTNVRREVNRFSTALASASTRGTASHLIEGYTSLNDRLRQVRLSLSDIARITSGIMISQTFYSGVHAIQSATQALWDFNTAIDYAQVSYGALFNSTDIATDFLATLQQFSVDTIFEYTDLEKMSRKLLAYGIEYKNLMYIIEGLTNIGTLSGDSAALDRLSVALGQINAKGKLQAEEIRQLTNAYAPMYEILQNEFNLSKDDLGNISDLALPAADVINAIVDYANAKFGDVADAAMLTITGLNNRIVDSMKVLGADITKPLTVFYKSMAVAISDQLSIIQDVYSKSGLAGVFEYIVPNEEVQIRLRQLIANFKNFVAQVIYTFSVLKPYLSQLFLGLLDVLNLFIAGFNTAAAFVTSAIHAIGSNTPILTMLSRALIIAAGAWALFKLQALGAMILTQLKVVIFNAARAVLFLSKALVSSPLITTLVLLGAVLLGLSTKANGANSAVSKLIESLNSYSAGGNIADDILKTDEALEKGELDSDQFWNKMEDGANGAGDAINGIGDAANNAAKAAKGLLSFDEVFKLPEKAAEADAGAGFGDLSGIGDLADVLGGLGDALIPEIPDFSSYARDFINGLYGDLLDAIKTIASGAATGTIIGGLVGFAIGGFVTSSMKGALAGAKLGAKIGTFAGAGFAAFWTDTYKEMEASLVNIAGGTAIGSLAGGLVGMVVGAFATRTLDGAITAARYGSTLGAILGAGLGGFWSMATEEMSNAIEGVIVGGTTGALAGGVAGLLIGAFATKTLAGALAGAKLGAGIGTLAGGALTGIFSSFEDELQKQISAIAWGGAEGTLVGGLAGMLLGAFATKSLAGALTGARLGSGLGMLVGGAIEGFFGDTEKTISERMSNMLSDVTAASYGTLIGGLAGMLVGAIVGVFAGGVGAIPGAKAGASIGAAAGGFVTLIVSYLKNSGVTEALAEWLGTVWVSVSDWLGQSMASIVNWLGGVKKAIADWLVDASSTISDNYGQRREALSNFLSGMASGIASWWSSIISGIRNGLSEASKNISDSYTERRKALSEFWSGVMTSITNLVSNIGLRIRMGLETIRTNISESYSQRRKDLSEFWNGVITNLSTWWTSIISGIRNWLYQIGQSLSDTYTQRRQALATFWSNAFNTVGTWLGNISNKVTTWLSNVAKDISTSYNERRKDLGNFFNGVVKAVVNWLGNVRTNISTWFTNLKSSVSTWWSNAFNPTYWRSGWSSISQWFSNLWSSISSWFGSLKSSIASWWDGLWADKKATVNLSTTGEATLTGHALGGIFTKEHIARFAEGNKAEAVIPLENKSAMQPFVDIISQGILEGLAPALVGGGGSGASDLPPMYVGTLVADERGLKELYKKFEVIRVQEDTRRGIPSMA